MLCCGKKETEVVDKDTVDPNQFLIGRRQNEKWKQWMSTEDLNAGDEIPVEFSDHEQYWRLELNESDFTWSFYVIRSGKKLYVSYDDTDKVTLEEDGNKERYFKVFLQIDGRFLIKTLKKDSDENRVLSIGSNGKLALLRGEVEVEPNEWFILKYFKDADKRGWFPVTITDSSGPRSWKSENIRKNDQVEVRKPSSKTPWTWSVKNVRGQEWKIRKGNLFVCQMDKSDEIILDEESQASGSDIFPMTYGSKLVDPISIHSPVDSNLYLSIGENDIFVSLKEKEYSTSWDVKLQKFIYWYNGHVKYYPPVRNGDESDDCHPDSPDSK